MGRICSATLKIDTPLNTELVTTILNIGCNIGFSYYASDDSEHSVSIDEAVKIVVQELNSENDNRYMRQCGSVDFKFQENFPIIRFYYYQPEITNIHLSTVSHPWCQDKSEDKDCIADWDLYITLLLELCKDFAILEISTSDEYFNWD